MISIGQKVRIARGNPNDCFDKKYLRQTGVVVRREFGTGPLPCGESPTDPLYIVKTDKGTDAFWTEELEVIK